jgi:cytoplasmic iron level regulating protein YaaA (DUF328/UPF0246 family)
MLTVISPAKKLDMTPVDVPRTKPDMVKEAGSLAATARGLTINDLQKLMHISKDLATLNRDRFKMFSNAPTHEQTKQAAFMFAGDTYTGLEVNTLDDDALRYAQDHLRILSGLYGLLRPLDEIQPYRLEMGSRLQTRRGKSLYEYWGSTISKALNAQAEAAGTDTIVNCASQEYFGAVDLKALKINVITPTFLEDKPGGAKIVSFFAKKARGSMARFIVQNRITDMDGLKDFDLGGYAYQPDQSTPDKPVFLRADTQTLKKAS